VGLVRKYVYLVEKYVEGVRYKRKRAAQIRFRSKRGERREERTKRREEFVEPCNHLI